MGMENMLNISKNSPEIPKRLWNANEIGLKFAVGNIKVNGKENIQGIPKGAKVVIMTTHLTDLDIPIAIHAVAQDLDVAVMNMSVHHKPFGQQGELSTYIGVIAAGKENFIPIDTRKDETGKKSPKVFNPENFEPAAKAMEKGKAIMVAAHNPSQKPLQNLDNVKGGYGGVYLAELSDAYILPLTVVLDKAVGMHEDKLKTIKEKPNASVVIGKVFKLEKIDGIERFSVLDKKREDEGKIDENERMEFSKLADALREQSAIVMKKMSEQLTTQNI